MDLWSISYLKRRGTSAAAVVIPEIQNGTYTNTVTDPTDAAASISFNPSGLVSVFASSGSSYTWLPSGGVAANYSIFLHKDSGSGTLAGIAMDTWVNLAAVQTFGLSQATVGSKNWVGTMAIRLDSPATTFETVNLSFTTTVNAAEGGGGGPPDGGGGIEP